MKNDRYDERVSWVDLIVEAQRSGELQGRQPVAQNERIREKDIALDLEPASDGLDESHSEETT